MFSEQKKLQYQREPESFSETQRRISELSEKDKRLFEQLRKVRLGRYDVTCSVMCMIAEVYQNNAINAFDNPELIGA